MTQQWIGETFMTTSKRPEDAGRTIRIVRQNQAVAVRSFVVVNIAHPARPDLVGRESTISAKTLTGSAWRRLETTTGPPAAAEPSAARYLVEEALARIQDRHDQENLEAHTDCDTLVLLGGIRAALAACDNATTGHLDPAAVQVAIAAGMRTAG